MAAVSVGRAKTATLVAATADTITFTAPTSTPCEIVNLDASAVIWARLDGTATVAGDDCIPIPGNSSWSPPSTPTTISLISAGTPQYCVHRIV